MAGLFQPKRVQVPGLLSDEGLSVALKNLSDTTKQTANAAPPNTSAIEAANQVTNEALKPSPTVKTAAPRVPGVELSAGAPAAPATPTDTRVGFGGTVTGFDVGKAITQAGTLTPDQGEADRVERAAQAGAEAEVATGELAEKTDLLSADEREAIGLPPLTAADTERLSASIAQEQEIVKEKQGRAAFIKEGPAATQAEWLNLAQVGTRSAIQMGVQALRYPADIWDTLAAIEKGSDEIKKSEVSLYLDNVDKALTQMMPGDKTRSKDFTTKLAAGTGSMVGFMITGWAGRAVGLPAWLTTGTLGAAVEGDSLYQEADTFGATATQKLIALFAGSGLGVTEAIPIDRAFMRADAASGGMIRNLLANSTSSSLEEFIQEASQSLGEDIIAKYGVSFDTGYDPARQISIDNALENGLIGAITGGVVGGATTLLSNGQQVEHLTQDEAKITETVDAALAEEQQRFASIIGDEGVDGRGEVAAPAQGASAEAPAGSQAAPAGPDPVRGDAVQQIVENQAAFHGTPHKFDKFSMEKIGTGEGAQAFGHGLYFAGSRNVANHYRLGLSGGLPKVTLRGKEVTTGNASAAVKGLPADEALATAKVIAQLNKDVGGGLVSVEDAFAAAKKAAQNTIDGYTKQADERVAQGAAESDVAVTTLRRGAARASGELAAIEALKPGDFTTEQRGALYQVDIPDDAELLDWDAPLSEQPETVQEALAGLDPDFWSPDSSDYDAAEPGQMIYSRLSEMLGGDAAASEALRGMGVPGLRYLDAGSRTAGDGTRNYVIFDDSRIAITDVEAQVANPIAAIQLEATETAPLPSATTSPNPNAVKAARAYTAAAGLPTRRQRDAAPANPARSSRIAQAYADMKHEPADPAVLSSYQALVEEVQAQYVFASAAGPLPAPADMPVYPPDHPLAPVAEQFWALHRFFGEGLEGANDPENMWQAHSRLFSASALPAFTAETRANPPVGTLDGVEQRAKSQGVKLDVSENADTITLSRIVVPEAQRSQGVGTKVMQDLLAYADGVGKTVALTPAGDFGGTVSRLKDFYQGLGFAPRAKSDFSTRESMTRAPQPRVTERKVGQLPSWTWQEGVEDTTAYAISAPVELTGDGLYYHGTSRAFEGPLKLPGNRGSGGNAVFLSTSPIQALTFARGETQRLLAAKVNAKKVFNYQDDTDLAALGEFVEKNFDAVAPGALYGPKSAIEFLRGGDFGLLEQPAVRRWMRSKGYDSFWVREYADSPLNIGVLDPSVIEQVVSPQEQFHAAVQAAVSASPYGAVTKVYSPAKYAKMRTFLSPDGQSGFALDGEKIVSLFGADPTQLRKIVDTAVANGGRTFEGFDAGLPEMLASLGFRETGRKPWSDAYAPKDWPNGLGKPDVVSMEWSGSDVEAIVGIAQARSIDMSVELPADPVFADAVANTHSAEITGDGLVIDLVRFQKPEQEGATSVRTGVFYLPAGSASAKFYKGGTNAYGGKAAVRGKTLIKRPIFVKGATGGKAPELAYDAIKGKGAYEKMRNDVLAAIRDKRMIDERGYNLLEEYGADGNMIWEIVPNSTQGNTLAYALQENIVAHAVREAGYDAVLGYSVGRGDKGAFLSEVFDVREVDYPVPGELTAALHSDFRMRDPEAEQVDRMTGTATVRQPYLAEPTRPTKGIPSPTPAQPNQEDVRLSAISSNFVKVLGLTARHGRLAAKDSNVMGEYNRRTAAIRLRTWTDLSTLVHEGGHALNDSMSAPMNAFVQANITEINAIAHKFYAGDLSKATGETVRREGFAEFFRVYTLNPAFARNRWPQLVDAFETTLKANDPKILDGLNSIAAQFDAWLQLPSKQLIRNMVVDGRRESGIDAAVKELRDRGFKGWMSEYARRATQVVVNRYVSVAELEAQLLNLGEANRGAPIELQRSESPTAILRLARNAGSRAQVEITDGILGYRSTQSSSRGLREALMTALGIPPDTTPGSLDADLMKDFDAYIVARRAFDEYRRFDLGEIERPPIGAQKGDVVRTIKEYEQSQPQFVPAAAIVHEYGMAMWQKRYDAGLMDKDTYEEGLQRQFYAPLQRDVSDKQGTGADSIGFSSSVLTKGPRFKGSDRDIISPMTVLMQMTFALEKQIAENDAKRALAILADRAGQAGALVERIPASQLIGQSFSVQQVAQRLTADAGLSAADASDLMTILGGSVDKGDVMTLFRSEQAGTQGENVLFFWENGKIAAIRLNDSSLASDVVNTMNAVGRENMDILLEGIAATSTVFRTAITSWPDFLVVNYIRDQMSAWILGGTGYVPFATGFQGISDEIRQKQWAKSYNAAGGIMGGMNVAALHTARVDRDIGALRAKGYIANVFGEMNGGWSNIPGAIKGLGRLTAITETGTRLGLYRGAYDRAIKDGLSEYDASVEAAYIATDYIDFGLNGSKMLHARRLVPFLNAQLQGLYKMVRTLGGDEVARRKGLRFALGAYFKNINNLPLSRLEQQQLRTGRAAWLKMMSLGLIGAALWAVFRDDPDYQEAGEYLRTTGWVIPTGDGKIAYIPKPFELALVSNAVERGLEFATGDTTAMDRFIRGVGFALTPPTAPPAVVTAFEVAANYDFFTGRPIVPEYTKALAPQLQYDNYTSSIAKWVGGVTGQSPLVVDHIMSGLGASAYRDISTILNAADPSRPMPDETEWPILRRFVRDVRRGSSSAQDFWAQASNTSGRLEQGKATYKRYMEMGNQPAANRFLDTLKADERAYAVLMTDFKPEEKRLNPFYRARQVTTIVSGMRRENSSELGLGDTTREALPGEDPMTFQLSRGIRTQVDDILSEIARREVRNTLIATGQPGWQDKEVLPLEPTLDMLLAVSPDTYDEFNRRRVKAKVYDAQSVYDYWPEVRDRLNSDGPDAILSDAVAVAGVVF